MATSLRPNTYFDALADEHRSWLSTFDQQYLANWDKVLAGDEEAALAEADVRRMLQSHRVRVEPNEHLTGAEQRRDFRCEANGSDFEVEVTHISIEKATKETGLVEGQTGFRVYGPLNDAIFVACKGKAAQCGNAHCPTLLAVATFHSEASALCFAKPHVEMLLTGETKITWKMDARTCQKVGDVYESTELRSAAFLRPDQSQGVGFARSSISALLLCGLRPIFRDHRGAWGPRVIGVLHPNAARPFDPAILPQLEFGQVSIDRASGQLHAAWPRGDDE